MMEKYFFDCGVLKSVIHKNRPKLTEAFYNSLQSREVFADEKPFFIYSPLLMIELIGKKPKDLIPLEELEAEFQIILKRRKYSDMNILLADIFTHIRKHFYRKQILTKKYLLSCLKEEMKYRDKWGADLLKTIYYDRVQRGRITDIHQNLAMEFIQAIDYQNYIPSGDLIKLDIQFFRSYIEFHLLKNMNIPFFRILSRAYERMNPGGKQWKFNYYEEMADCEIIHFALLGHKAQGVQSPVKIFTTEKLTTWKDRIQLTAGFLNFANNELVPLNNKMNPDKPLEKIMLKTGIIYQVDQRDGTILSEPLDVEKLLRESKKE